MQTILYPYQGNLYVNLTNRCPCRCTFCLRQTKDEMDGSGSLWLEHEPTVQEVKDELKKYDMSRYAEFVFCGFGEPTERLDAIVEITKFVRENYNIPIRVNTNGLSDLIHGRDTAPDFEGIDAVSISLNTPDKEEYLRLTRSKFGIESFDAILRFAGNVKNYVPKVILSTVGTTISAEDEDRCRGICENLGVTYRIRPFE
ncbi:MAG: TIGR04100 family radical SAM protein [Clostridia bacterium]